jgi:hypothetical protein
MDIKKIVNLQRKMLIGVTFDIKINKVFELKNEIVNIQIDLYL